MLPMTKLTDAEIIERLGGTTAVARMFDVKPPSISGWKKHGIPPCCRKLLMKEHPEVFEQEGNYEREKNGIFHSTSPE